MIFSQVYVAMLLEILEVFPGQVKAEQAARAVVRLDDDTVRAGHPQQFGHPIRLVFQT